jgi:hypothetical protein
VVTTEGRLIRPKMKYERDFTQIPNNFIRDEKLSYRARGILHLLLSHETGFSVTLKALASATPKEGLDAVRAAVEELEQHGYLRRYSSRRGGQFRADDWELTDPAEMLLPSLLTALDKTTRTALDNPTRKNSTALDKTTRTALDNPTTRRTQEEETTKSTRDNHKSGLKLVGLCETGQPHRVRSDGYCADCWHRIGQAS